MGEFNSRSDLKGESVNWKTGWNEAWKGKIWNIQKTSWETQRIWRKKI